MWIEATATKADTDSDSDPDPDESAIAAMKKIVSNFPCSFISLFDRDVLNFDTQNAESQHIHTSIAGCYLRRQSNNDA
jgi:hypothetical protein